jgi:hypothetical protein
MSVVCLKLTTGEEVMGDLVSQGAAEICLRDVAMIMMAPSQSGQMSLGLMPFLPYSDTTKFSFKTEHVLVQHTPSDELRNNYSRMFGAGIQIAKTF